MSRKTHGALAKQSRTKRRKSSRESKKFDTKVYNLRLKSEDARWFSKLCRAHEIYGWQAFKRLRNAFERFDGRVDLDTPQSET